MEYCCLHLTAAAGPTVPHSIGTIVFITYSSVWSLILAMTYWMLSFKYPIVFGLSVKHIFKRRSIENRQVVSNRSFLKLSNNRLKQ